MILSELLAARRGEILDAAAGSLAGAHLTHYEAEGALEVRLRLARLFDLTAAAVSDRNLTAILRHAAEIAGERFTTGFGLTEVQAAFNALEEAIWQQIVAEVPPHGLAEAFGLVSTVLGAGKDRLASTYVELASRAKAPSLDLRALFSGTAEG